MTEYNKAIRDKIPEIIKESGFESKIEILSDEKFLIKLEEKLKEELEEYNQSKSVEELADLLEVIERIAELKGITLESLNNMKEQKSKERGKFKKNLFLLESNNS
jgi:predicted house-cleaning noncanonical NTP pyrophosphatase (MazG superfamily)